jgi:hypothetical protein
MMRPAVLVLAILACGCANIPADNPPETPAASASAELAGGPDPQRAAATPAPIVQPTPTPRAQLQAPADATPVPVGGYVQANPADPNLAAAEKLAIDEIYRADPQRSLVESVMREQQVVAGMNYRFTIKMSGTNSYRIVVYKPLQGEMTVTSFEKHVSLN